MGFMACMAPCVNCHTVFSFNPDLVPAIRVNDKREPICPACVEAANPLRIANGLEPITPLPGAYDAAEVD